MRANTLLAVALAFTACKKKSADTPPPSAGPPASTADQDALWKLAPDGAFAGGVVSPAALTRLEAGYNAVTKTINAVPEMAPLKAQLDQELQEALGTSTASLAALGFTSKPGIAFFATGEDEVIAILPVADRDKFLAVTKGTKGTDSDTIKRATCKTVKGVYACTRTAALFDRLGKGDMSSALKLAGARGDIELVVAIPNTQIQIAGVAQLGPGGFTVRAAVKGAPPGVKQFLVNGKPRTDGDKTAGFALLEFAGYLKMLKDKVPPLPIAPGVTADALVKSIDGPLTLTIDNGSTMIDLRLPLNNPDPSKALLAACDQLPPLAQAGATVKDGTCHVSVPQMQMDIDGWVDGKTLRIGKKGAQSGSGPSAAMSPVAKELASGEWIFTMFGRGTMFGKTSMQLPGPPPQMPPQALLGIRAMTVLNEIGIGVRLDGDVIRGIATVRTIWSNPDDVVAKLVAIDPLDVLQGKGGDKGMAIADAHPKSPFAGDYQTGISGLMVPAATLGVLAAVAVPAFMDYMKKSKKSEASLQLNKLAKSLKVYAIEKSAFPIGTVGPSPSKPCCGSTPTNKCFDPDAWKAPLWTELDFMIDEPHLYRYSYSSQDGKSFVAKAAADLDCDGQEAEYVMTGTLDAQGNPQVDIAPPQPGEY
jgi:type IV pilus assembly protein PilA